MSDVALMDIFNLDTSTSTLEFLTSQIHFYHSDKHPQHDTAQTSNSTHHRDTKWSPASSSQLIEQYPNIESCYPGCKPEVFLMGKYSSFFHKMRCILCIVFIKGQVLKASQESKYKCPKSSSQYILQYYTILHIHSSLPLQVYPKLPYKSNLFSKTKTKFFLSFITYFKLVGLGDKLLQSCHI